MLRVIVCALGVLCVVAPTYCYAFLIAHGKRVRSISDAPWQAAIQFSATNGAPGFCGGVIIAAEWILTAAHCFNGETDLQSAAQRTKVRAGFSKYEEAPRLSVARIIIHPGYDSRFDLRARHTVAHFDIALVQLAANSALPPDANKIEMADDQDTNLPPSWPLKITGWGQFDEKHDLSVELLWGEVFYTANSTCNKSEEWANQIVDSMLCAARTDTLSDIHSQDEIPNCTGKQAPQEIDSPQIWEAIKLKKEIVPDYAYDTCAGDSGGPVVFYDQDGNSPRLLGITSTGKTAACGGKNQYGVYTRVSSYRKWIDYYINPPLKVDARCPVSTPNPGAKH